MNVREHILRQYYESSFGTQSPNPQAFNGSTFDEFLELFRIAFPAATARHAARMSPAHLGFRQLAETLQDPPTIQADSAPGYQYHARKAELDLDRLITADHDVQTLHLDRIRELRNLSALTNFPRLRRLWLIFCESTDEIGLQHTISLDELKLTNCSIPITRKLVAGVSAKNLYIENSQPSTFHLDQIPNPSIVERLTVLSPSISSYGQIRKMPLVYLYLANSNASDQLWKNLATCEKLTELIIAGRPFPPNVLPTCPALTHFTVEAFPEFRDLWITWATQHPYIKCKFLPRAALVPSFEKTTIAEVYRNIDILMTGKGKSPKYRASFLTSELIEYKKNLDSSVVEQILHQCIRKTNIKMDITSEADEVIIETNTLGNCKSIIDYVTDNVRG